MNNKKSVDFGEIIKAIMTDYEELAKAHNILMITLFKKGVITNEDWSDASKQFDQEKEKAQERVSKAINDNSNSKSKIIKV